MKEGKLQLGSEAVVVQYELHTELIKNRRETGGRLIVKQPPIAELSNAIAKMEGANLVTDDDQVYWIEFTKNLNGREIEFKALPPKGSVVNRNR